MAKCKKKKTCDSNWIFPVLRYLQKLDLSYNDIERFENLNHLNIVDLSLEDNAISTFEEGEEVGLKTLLNLFNLDLSKNKLSSLKLFEASSLWHRILTNDSGNYYGSQIMVNKTVFLFM